MGLRRSGFGMSDRCQVPGPLLYYYCNIEYLPGIIIAAIITMLILQSCPSTEFLIGANKVRLGIFSNAFLCHVYPKLPVSNMQTSTQFVIGANKVTMYMLSNMQCVVFTQSLLDILFSSLLLWSSRSTEFIIGANKSMIAPFNDLVSVMFTQSNARALASLYFMVLRVGIEYQYLARYWNPWKYCHGLVCW